ncbi:MAG: carboxypeptidase-like regulatory domain-containing protein [Pyrinomonadaceae bacterium]
MRNPLLIALAVVLCGLLFSGPVTAQTINGSISGQIVDANGAAVAGANVTVTNAETGQSRGTMSNDEGLYRVSSLAIGPYTIKVEKSGFGSAAEDTRVSSGVDTAINFKLSAGTLTAQVEVSDTGAVLETTQSQVVKTDRWAATPNARRTPTERMSAW